MSTRLAMIAFDPLRTLEVAAKMGRALLVELLLLGDLAAQPAPSAISKETDQILSTIPGHETCANPNENDARPYTLCLSETWFEQAEAELESQFKVTLAHVEATRGPVPHATLQIGS